jgi:hypothetical protein
MVCVCSIRLEVRDARPPGRVIVTDDPGQFALLVRWLGTRGVAAPVALRHRDSAGGVTDVRNDAELRWFVQRTGAYAPVDITMTCEVASAPLSSHDLRVGGSGFGSAPLSAPTDVDIRDSGYVAGPTMTTASYGLMNMGSAVMTTGSGMFSAPTLTQFHASTPPPASVPPLAVRPPVPPPAAPAPLSDEDMCTLCGDALVDGEGAQCDTCATVLCQRCANRGLHPQHTKHVRVSRRVADLMGMDCRCVAEVSGCIAAIVRISASASLLRTFRLHNIGVRAWPVGCRLTHTDGEKMEVVRGGALYESVMPDCSVDLDVVVRVPQLPGRCTCQWRLSTPSGGVFGAAMVVTVDVL